MKKPFFILIVLLLFLFSTSKVFAASVNFSPLPDVNVGDNFDLDINADTDGESINSVDMVVEYREDLMSFVGYKTNGTVINVWITSPKESDGKIYMSGIIPGGVSGLYDANKKTLGDIPLVHLLFLAKQEGTANFSFSKSSVLKNDGKGTELVHQTNDIDVTIKNSDTTSEDSKDTKDITPPEPFTIEFIEASSFSRTPSMIRFKTDDVDSGVKYYTMKTGISPWREVQSPEPIRKTIFSRNSTIRAYDFYGNFQDANIHIPGLISDKILWILCGVFLSGILAYKLLRYRR